MPDHIHFTANVPQVLSLSDPMGDWDGGYTVSYPTEDRRTLVLPKQTAVRLNLLGLQAGETFGICRRAGTEPGSPSYWDIWLTPETEQRRAEAEKQEQETKAAAEPVQPKGRKLRSVPRKPPVPEQPRLFDRRGTGTDGPLPECLPPIPATLPHRLPPPARIPYNVAFSEVLAFVTRGLKDAGTQWNDQAVQDAVCTILISAQKQGLLTLWERENNDQSRG